MDEANDANSILVYHQGRRTNWARTTRWVLAGLVLAGFAVGVGLFLTYGTSPGDGGQLAPLETRFSLAMLAGMSGIGIAAVTALIQGLYVHSIRYDAAADLLYVRMHGVWREPLIALPVASVDHSWSLGGQADIELPVSEMPTLFLHVDARMLPLLVDLEGEIPDPALLRWLLKIGEPT